MRLRPPACLTLGPPGGRHVRRAEPSRALRRDRHPPRRPRAGADGRSRRRARGRRRGRPPGRLPAVRPGRGGPPGGRTPRHGLLRLPHARHAAPGGGRSLGRARRLGDGRPVPGSPAAAPRRERRARAKPRRDALGPSRARALAGPRGPRPSGRRGGDERRGRRVAAAPPRVPRPAQRFRARAAGRGALVADAAGFAGYDAFGDVIASVDARAAAEAYRTLEPLFDEAHRELGHPEGRFRTSLDKAVAALLATPVPAADAPLERHATLLRWADPALEALTPAQKQFLRIGPRNVRIVQGKLRELQSALAAPPAP
ncbi:MAG: DUF3014 domain-containing protein [Vicinamibacteria bacterium]